MAAQEQAGEEDGAPNFGRLCTEARLPPVSAAAGTTRATQVCVDREAREGRLEGELTNTGTTALCGATMRVLTPMFAAGAAGLLDDVGGEGRHAWGAKRMSSAMPLVEDGEPPLAPGEGRAFVVTVAAAGMGAQAEGGCVGCCRLIDAMVWNGMDGH